MTLGSTGQEERLGIPLELPRRLGTQLQTLGQITWFWVLRIGDQPLDMAILILFNREKYDKTCKFGGTRFQTSICEDVGRFS